MSCENCQACNRCTPCNGCQQNASLNPLGCALLDVFSVTPFLPVALDKHNGRICVLDPEFEPYAASLALRMLQRKGLVQVDADFPIKNADYKGYEDWAHGSAALTARGQEAVDALDYGGKEHAK